MDKNDRWDWLKFMRIYTADGAHELSSAAKQLKPFCSYLVRSICIEVD